LARVKKHSLPVTSPEKVDVRPWYEYSAAAPLSVTHRKVAAEWHQSKNGTWTPGEFTYGSQERVWWLCKEDRQHAWAARIQDRAVNGSGCPFCAGKRASATYNLRTLFPEVAAEWHPKRNGRVRPEQVLPKSSRVVWWQCRSERDHEWTAMIANRTKHGSGCPYCAGSKPSRTNSLATLFPELAKEWHPKENGELSPADVTFGSNRVVWWQCPRGKDHVFQNSVRTRTKTGKGCPFCHGLKASTTNSLVSLFPNIAAEWHRTKNGGLSVETIVARSPRKVWWRCAANQNHVWEARVQDRTQKGSGCPSCARSGR